MTLRLIDLEPHTLEEATPEGWREDGEWANAVGLRFLCPKCFIENANSDIGVHSVICWKPIVPQTCTPRPGRWD